MSQSSVSIVGAGLGGRVLGQALRKKGIPATIFEKGTAAPRHPYGITLCPWAFKPLCKILGIDEYVLRKKVSVDAPRYGQVYARGPREFFIRAHRGKFEQLLGEGLDIRYNHTLDSIDHSRDHLTLSFANGEKVAGSLVIALDGVHSTVRKALLPEVQPKILNYVVYNGKRRVKRGAYDELYKPMFKNGNVAECKKDDCMLQVSINERKELNSEEEKKDNLISISFTYSRPARPNDPLHNPNRPTAGATEISGALWDEIDALKGLPQPFNDVFDVQTLKRERLLHWLMRTVLVKSEELKELGKKHVLLAGDAAHAEPILGGNGANAAIMDGLELAEVFAEKGVSADAIDAFYDRVHARWVAGVEKSEQEISRMH